MNILNKKEIAVFGIRRSGSHAIISWLLRHTGRHGVYLNNVIGESPYESCAEIRAHRLCPWRCKPKIKNIFKNIGRKGAIEYSRKDRAVNWKYIRNFSPKDCLILSYKNRFLDDAAYAAFVQRHDLLVGRSEQRHRVVVLRDAFSLFASLLRAPQGTAHDIATCVRLYKHYAELFLDAARQQQLNIICINYNKWLLSPGYRRLLMERFGGAHDRDPRPSAPLIRGNGFFDYNRQGGHAPRFKVPAGHQACMENPLYRAIFQDTRLVELSESVFGSIAPATH